MLIAAVIVPIVVNRCWGSGWAVTGAGSFFFVWSAVGPRPYLNTFGAELIGLGGFGIMFLSIGVWLYVFDSALRR